MELGRELGTSTNGKRQLAPEKRGIVAGYRLFDGSDRMANFRHLTFDRGGGIIRRDRASSIALPDLSDVPALRPARNGPSRQDTQPASHTPAQRPG